MELDLSRHCIETEIRRRYNQALSQYFGPHANRSRLEEQISLLKAALESFDFPGLRSRYPALAGGRPDLRIRLIRTADGRPFLEFDTKNGKGANPPE